MQKYTCTCTCFPYQLFCYWFRFCWQKQSCVSSLLRCDALRSLLDYKNFSSPRFCTNSSICTEPWGAVIDAPGKISRFSSWVHLEQRTSSIVHVHVRELVHICCWILQMTLCHTCTHIAVCLINTCTAFVSTENYVYCLCAWEICHSLLIV